MTSSILRLFFGVAICMILVGCAATSNDDRFIVHRAVSPDGLELSIALDKQTLTYFVSVKNVGVSPIGIFDRYSITSPDRIPWSGQIEALDAQGRVLTHNDQGDFWTAAIVWSQGYVEGEFPVTLLQPGQMVAGTFYVQSLFGHLNDVHPDFQFKDVARFCLRDDVVYGPGQKSLPISFWVDLAQIHSDPSNGGEK